MIPGESLQPPPQSPDASPPALSSWAQRQRLRELERDGLVQREVFNTKPPSVSYSLTDLGRSFLGPLHGLVDWAGAQMPAIARARAAFDQG